MDILHEMLDGYIECAMWTAEMEERTMYSDSQTEAMLDITAFVDSNKNEINIYLKKRDAAHLGHDLWLSRNRHGTGFFDRHIAGEETYNTACDALQVAAEAMGERNVYAHPEYHLLAEIGA